MAPGMPVYDVSGQVMGSVGELGPRMFEVVPGHGPSVWVSEQAVYHVDFGVTLLCNRGRVLEYRVR